MLSLRHVYMICNIVAYGRIEAMNYVP